MEHLNKKEEICRKVAENFRFAGKITKMSPYGSGHINDTFMLTCELEDGSNKHYILQRMNDDIFRNPKELMENVVNVTTFLRKKIIAAGGDPERETPAGVFGGNGRLRGFPGHRRTLAPKFRAGGGFCGNGTWVRLRRRFPNPPRRRVAADRGGPL